LIESIVFSLIFRESLSAAASGGAQLATAHFG